MYVAGFFWLLIILISQIYGKNEPRIKNGVITPDDLFQFTAFLYSPTSAATGTVISKRHILTCAHFLLLESVVEEHERYMLYLNISYHAELRPVAEWVNKSALPMSNKGYIPKTYKWPWGDIAILEFPEGTNFGAEPVKLAKDYLETKGDEAYIAGFGAWWINGTESSGGSNILRHAKITMIDDCFGTLKICGGNETHRALPGDSGGPMLIYRNNQWYQIGVSATSVNYDIRNRVSSFCNFIEEVTNNEVQCESIYPDRAQLPSLPLKIIEPLYKGQSTPAELFNFIVPLYNYYYHRTCTATVISKRHLLTSAYCVFEAGFTNENKNIHLTEHSTYKSLYGKLFPDFRSTNAHSNLLEPINVTAYFPLNYKWPWDHNIAVIEFPEGTDFGVERVALPFDFVQIYLDASIIAGYGKYEFKENMHIKELPPILQHSKADLKNDDFLSTKAILENENLRKDEGGPSLIERNGKFYQIGINFGEGTPNGYRTFVSAHCNFIQDVTKNEVKCESIAPIHETPSTTPLVLYEPATTKFYQEPFNNNASVIDFKVFLIIVVTIFSV